MVLVMEVSNSHGGVRRCRDNDVTSSGTGKRRRFSNSHDQENNFQLDYQSRRENFHENIVSTAVSTTTDHVSSFMRFEDEESTPDLKAECLPETETFISCSDGFSGETSASSVVCLETEEMESSSTSNPKKNKSTATNEATSRRKSSVAAKMPSAAELEEFFSEAEKYEQKRFADKYNYDIVKDVPMEGRYQWVRLKP